MPGWVVWIVLAAVLAGAELMTLTFVLGMIAVAALVAAGVDALGGPLALQLVAFGGTSVGLIVAVRPLARRHLRTPTSVRTGVAALTGTTGLVVERVDRDGGRVKLAGEIWSARSFDEQALEPGARVEVVRIDGATAIVWAAG